MRDPKQDLDELESEGLLRRLRVLDGPQDSTVYAETQDLLNFSSNDYLGLANDEEIKDKFRAAVDKYGAGAGASRLISGTMVAHCELEEKLAALKRTEAALTFSSGYATATGSIPAILDARKGDIVILDKLCHASLIDGARLSGARMRVFPHNNLEKLEKLLLWANQNAGPESRILVLTESAFSMDGDLAPLERICELKEKAGALLLIDEAHSFGVIGPHGRGLAAKLNLEERIDFQMGTLSKAVGLSGGYLCSSRAWIDLLINKARSLVFSTAPSPALAATISSCLDLVTGQRGDDLREKLWQNIRLIKEDATSAIIPLLVGESEKALQLSRSLRERGFLVPAIRFPTVPRKTARLRLTLSAGSQHSDVEKLKQALEELELFQ